MYEGFGFSLPTLVTVCFYYLRVKWYVIVVLICISLITNDVNIFLHAYWPFMCLIWGNVYSDPVSILTDGHFSIVEL